MIRHIVFFSAKNAADVARIKEGLNILRAIPGSLFFEVAENARWDAASKEIDLVVYSEFESVEALASFKDHPLYAESISCVRPLRSLRLAVDFESEEGRTSL